MSISLDIYFENCKNNGQDSIKKVCERLVDGCKDVRIGNGTFGTSALLEYGVGIDFYASDKSSNILITCISSPLILEHPDYEGTLEMRINSLINAAKLVYKYARPQFGVGDFETVFSAKIELFVGWITFFSPELVKKYGKEKLLSAPAYKAEELSDGGILIRASYGPALSGFPSEEEIKKRKLKKEDLDLYDEDVMRKKISEYLNIGVKN